MFSFGQNFAETDVVGSICYVMHDNINWVVPSFDVFQGTRVWSPEFYFPNTGQPLHSSTVSAFGNLLRHSEETPRGCLGLFISSSHTTYISLDSLRIGVMSLKSGGIFYSDVEWIGRQSFAYPEPFKYLRVTRLFHKDEVKGSNIFQLFCEKISMHEHQVGNAPSVHKISCGDFLNNQRERSMDTLQRLMDFPEEKSLKPPLDLVIQRKSTSMTTVADKETTDVQKTDRNTLGKSSSKPGDANQQNIKTTVADKKTTDVQKTDRNTLGNSSSKPDNANHQNIKTEKTMDVQKTDRKTSGNSNSKLDDADQQNIKNLEKLSQNLKDLYVDGKDSDLTLKVEDREFRAHKAILRARSSVFDAMFSHDFSENQNGVVPIQDCEPAIFEEFLYFVYAAKTQHLSSDNVCELYYVADKYDLTELKEECLSFIKTSLSVEIICDVVCLSTKHNETELLEIAILFFARNMDHILVTNNWQLFLKQNPIEANELCIKALKLGYRKIEM